MPSDPQSGETFSRFGGLWIDRHDSEVLLAQRKNSLSDEVVQHIEDFMRDGYAVIKDAVPKPLTAAIRGDLEHHWANPPKEARVEHWHNGKLHLIPPKIELREGPTKLLDIFAFSANARRAIAAPRVVEFLTAIFGARPKAFQSLTFWRGSQQPIHKDSAYVQIDGAPMQIAATWLALEDIQPGTGELEYYVGSHRAPDFLFAGEHKWLEAAPHEHER
jgi:ectoine hydroxylase-related dioxygenase (phytanoyl-CoA dioxygenase family)